ncbi:unnamed protein product, partial [Polarella glacialis]
VAGDTSPVPALLCEACQELLAFAAETPGTPGGFALAEVVLASEAVTGHGLPSAIARALRRRLLEPRLAWLRAGPIAEIRSEQVPEQV